MAWLVLITLAIAQSLPTDHTLIYYNARMALREGETLEAIKLWLLRNALEEQTGQVSPHDGDFHSVTWAALGELGVCPDGHPVDEDGAGLWPIAMHNWVLRNMGRREPPRRPRAFDAFRLGRQSRFIAIGDVLSATEMGSVRLFRGACSRPRVALVAAGELPNADLSDRQVAARLLRYLLQQTRESLDAEQVRGRAVIEARLFDLNLQLASLAARQARQQAQERSRMARLIGLARESIEAMNARAPTTTLTADSEPARILTASLSWPVSEWMALSADRRRFIFDHALRYTGDVEALKVIAQDIIDALIVQGEGGEVDAWIALYSSLEGTNPQVIWSGERGGRLLALDQESGFTERGVIALHRGVQDLEQGDLAGALRSLAYALQLAPESRASDDLQGLSLRWMSYVAGQFEITEQLLVTLQELLPRREYGIILEDLMWRAAFHADMASFQRGIDNQLSRGAPERRITQLMPLAVGDLRRFSMQIRDGLAETPSETLRFIAQLVQRLELEDADVRTAHIPTLENLRRLLRPLANSETGRQGRLAGELMDQTLAIIEGVGGQGRTARDQARTLSPEGEVYAGSVRLAPADPLPWPFRSAEVAAPSVFSPIRLTPREWAEPSGALVFGWDIEG